ncbi:hypothetical protein FACS1894161_4840 [Spirochaetia bacterium]|nr:hypothetical protein FACS1894161_4840 [Spirochaetia bacterium]
MKAVFGTIAIALILGGFTDCKKKADEAPIRTVNVVTVTLNAPFSYLNKDGEYDGYEIAVLKEINKKLPQYAFRIDGVEFAGMSLALEVGTASIAVGTFVRSEARQAKFIFPNTIPLHTHKPCSTRRPAECQLIGRPCGDERRVPPLNIRAFFFGGVE